MGRWAEEKFAENIAPPEVVEAVSSDVVGGACEKHPLCVISFLPHILDCDASCRNGHIDNLKKLGEKYKKKDWGWRRWLSQNLRRRLMWEGSDIQQWWCSAIRR